MRECRTYGSVRGALGNGRLYRDHIRACRIFRTEAGVRGIFRRFQLTRRRAWRCPRQNGAGISGKPRQGGHQAATILARCGLWAAAFGRPGASGRGPMGRYHARALRPLDCRDAGRCSPGQSGPFCAGVAVWMVATRSGRPVALGRRLGSRRTLDAPRPKLGLPFAPRVVAKCTVGKRPGRTLGMARRLGSRRHLGAPRSELGLPLAVADSWHRPFSRVGRARGPCCGKKLGLLEDCPPLRNRSGAKPASGIFPVSEFINRLGKRSAIDAGQARIAVF